MPAKPLQQVSRTPQILFAKKTLVSGRAVVSFGNGDGAARL